MSSPSGSIPTRVPRNRTRWWGRKRTPITCPPQTLRAVRAATGHLPPMSHGRGGQRSPAPSRIPPGDRPAPWQALASLKGTARPRPPARGLDSPEEGGAAPPGQVRATSPPPAPRSSAAAEPRSPSRLRKEDGGQGGRQSSARDPGSCTRHFRSVLRRRLQPPRWPRGGAQAPTISASCTDAEAVSGSASRRKDGAGGSAPCCTGALCSGAPERAPALRMLRSPRQRLTPPRGNRGPMASVFTVARQPVAARWRRLASGLRLRSSSTGTCRDGRRETVRAAYPVWSSVALEGSAGTWGHPGRKPVLQTGLGRGR